MPVSWRHRIVRVVDEDSAIAQAVIGLVEDGWIFVARENADPGSADLVFRRASLDHRSFAWS